MHLWEAFLQEQEAELGKQTVDKWLRTLKIQRFDAGNLYLEAKDSFQLLWFEEHIRSKTEKKLLTGNNRPIKVHLSVASGFVKEKKKSQAKKEAVKVPFSLSFEELDPLFSLEDFLVTADNHMSFQIVQEATLIEKVRSFTPSFNPIYLHGPSGAGKTHLLMALVRSFQRSGIKALYVKTELFTDHVIRAIRAGEMSLFRQAYRGVDLLAVDDVQLLSKKGATQEEFFHTFNTLHLDGKQILLAANCPPQGLEWIEPRLVSRFEWGITLPLKSIEEKDFKQLLEKRSRQLKFILSDNSADFLIETFGRNPKVLMKALDALYLRLHLDAHTSSLQLSPSGIKMLLADLIAEEAKASITPQKIIEAVALHYGISEEDLLGKSQVREYVLPRQIAMHLCRNKLKQPFMKIGALFGRDHSTVMTSVKHIQKQLDEEEGAITTAWETIVATLLK